MLIGAFIEPVAVVHMDAVLALLFRPVISDTAFKVVNTFLVFVANVYMNKTVSICNN